MLPNAPPFPPLEPNIQEHNISPSVQWFGMGVDEIVSQSVRQEAVIDFNTLTQLIQYG